MRCYAGLDTGTTNSKAIIINECGEIVFQETVPTPLYKRGKHKFFSIKGIEEFSDYIEEKARALGCLVSMGFSSVGESTVPVSSSGRALDDPPLWNETEITASAEEKKIIERCNPFSLTGIRQNGLLALDKILCLRRMYPQTYGKASSFLPISSYLAYRKTGAVLWDYSQALRSNAFLVHEKRWNSALLAEFGLSDFGALAPMGTLAGAGCDGVLYALGGHDHIAGLFFICNALAESAKPFFYESMGSSSVLALSVPFPESSFPSLKSYDPPEGSFIPGFKDDSFILTRSFRRFGLLNSFWMNLSGPRSYGEINSEIMKRKYEGLAFLAECDSDFIRGNTSDGALNFYQIKPKSDIVDMMQSTYLYLSVGTFYLEDALRRALDIKSDCPFFAGGAAAADSVFMRFQATALGHAIQCMDARDISAMGALCTGLIASDEVSVLSSLSERARNSIRRIDPDDALEERVSDAKEEYSHLIEKIRRKERI